MTPKGRRVLRPTDARGLGVLPRAARTRRGPATPPARLPAVRPSLRHLRRVTPTTWRPRSSARSRRKAAPGRADQSLLASPSTSRKRRWQCEQVTAAVRVPRGRDRRGAGAASPTTDAAKRRSAAATMQSQKFFPVHRLRNLFLLSAHGYESNCACARGREGKRSVHSRRLSRRILALTLQLTILPAQ